MIRGEAFIVVGWRPPRTTRSGESPDWSNIWPQRWERASRKRTIPHTMYTSTGITIIPVSLARVLSRLSLENCHLHTGLITIIRRMITWLCIITWEVWSCMLDSWYHKLTYVAGNVLMAGIGARYCSGVRCLSVYLSVCNGVAGMSCFALLVPCFFPLSLNTAIEQDKTNIKPRFQRQTLSCFWANKLMMMMTV